MDSNIPLLNVTEAQIAHVKVMTLIDTGASCSAIQNYFLKVIKDKYPAIKLDVVVVENIKIKTVDENNIKVHDRIIMLLNLKTVSKYFNIYICSLKMTLYGYIMTRIFWNNSMKLNLITRTRK